MNNSLSDPLEELLQAAAHSFRYPPTPDITGAARGRLGGRDKTHALRGLQGPRFVWAAALVVVLLLVGLMSVPTVRGAVLEFLQIGVVRIFPDAQFARPTTEPVASPSAQPAGLPTVESTPPFLVYDLVSIFDLDGETSLDEARNAFDVPLRLPSYPPGLGEPERVFLQEMDGSMVVLVWTDPEDPGKARLSLHIIEPGSFAIEKFNPELIQTTQVNGHEAIWAVGPYPVHLKNYGLDIRRIVNGYVLIWTEGGITYRLETDLPLEEALKIAESLK